MLLDNNLVAPSCGVSSFCQFFEKDMDSITSSPHSVGDMCVVTNPEMKIVGSHVNGWVCSQKCCMHMLSD